MEVYDVCIVGVGGVVGHAIARELALKHWSVAGLEKHNSAAQETSGRNSRVIHDKTSPLLINLIGMDSPVLSASLAIARHAIGLIGLGRDSRE